MPGKGARVVGPASPQVLETEIDGDVSIYDPGNEQVTVLNGTASDIWRLAAGGEHTLDEMTTLLASSYGVSIEEIAQDVAAAVDRLVEAGLIELS